MEEYKLKQTDKAYITTVLNEDRNKEIKLKEEKKNYKCYRCAYSIWTGVSYYCGRVGICIKE